MKIYSIYDAAQVFKTQLSPEGLSRSRFCDIFIYPKDNAFELHGQVYLEFDSVIYFIDTARKKVTLNEDQDNIKKMIATGKLEKFIYRLFIKSNFSDDDNVNIEQEKGNHNE